MSLKPPSFMWTSLTPEFLRWLQTNGAIKILEETEDRVAFCRALSREYTVFRQQKKEATN